MIKEAIDRILQVAAPNIFNVGGHSFSDRQLSQIQPVNPPVNALEVSTLEGLITFVKSNIDELKAEELLINIVSQTKVYLRSSLDCFNYRQCLVSCIMNPDRNTYSNGQFVPAEDFIISLQSAYEQTEERDEIIKLISSITEENVRKSNDDGVSQVVTTRKGIVKQEEKAVPGRVILRPIGRTFPELDPAPGSIYQIRLKDGPQCALFLADGDQWKLSAIKRIRAFFADALPDVCIIA